MADREYDVALHLRVPQSVAHHGLATIEAAITTVLNNRTPYVFTGRTITRLENIEPAAVPPLEEPTPIVE